MPRLAKYSGRLDELPFDFDELLAAIAPRRVFISAPLQDSNFQWQSVDRVAAAAREVFALYGDATSPIVVHPESPHDFPDATREQAYAFLSETLNAK